MAAMYGSPLWTTLVILSEKGQEMPQLHEILLVNLEFEKNFYFFLSELKR
jgi:hypothetical protein